MGSIDILRLSTLQVLSINLSNFKNEIFGTAKKRTLLDEKLERYLCAMPSPPPPPPRASTSGFIQGLAQSVSKEEQPTPVGKKSRYQ